MEIDWSKAPESATHYGPKTEEFNAHWFKLQLDGWAMWHGWKWTTVGILKERLDTMVSRPAPWTGEGLPSVGTVCEIHHASWAQNDWQPTDIRYISSDYLIVGGGAFKSEQHFHLSDMSFRPIRTAEQIEAAAEYEFFDKMHEDLGEACERENLRKLAHYLWKAGYRKVQP